jgi:hypothetical protein
MLEAAKLFLELVELLGVMATLGGAGDLMGLAVEGLAGQAALLCQTGDVAVVAEEDDARAVKAM